MKTLGQLEEVLLAVDDLEGADWSQLANVSRVEPAISVQDFVSLLLVLIACTSQRYKPVQPP